VIKSDSTGFYQEKIEKLRREMVSMGMELGLNHPDVIQKSHELDSLHNLYLQDKATSV